ncbi:TPA: PucR family transcriptional regulator [Streptococcus suis]
MLAKVLSLYPTAQVNPENPDHLVGSHIMVTIEDQLIAVPRKDLSISERELLLLMDQSLSQETPPMPQTSIWKQFLEGKGTQTPVVSGDLIFIHLHFKTPIHQFDKDLWFTTLEDANDRVLDWFSTDTQSFVLVLKAKESDLQVRDDMEALIRTLNNDFDIMTQAIQGLPHAYSLDLPRRYQEERTIVEAAFKADLQGDYQAITALLLQQIGELAFQHFPLIHPIKQFIQANPEYVSLIQTLFEHHGNLSQAADRLYIHRNTLSYRIQKFYKETGLQLNSLPDLVICYLSIT